MMHPGASSAASYDNSPRVIIGQKATADTFLGLVAEETFTHVQPGGRSRNKGDVKPLVPSPAHYPLLKRASPSSRNDAMSVSRSGKTVSRLIGIE